MPVVKHENKNSVFTEMMIDPRMRALSLPARRASSRRGAPENDGAGLFEVLCDPYEWKSAVRFALVIFVCFAVLAPALAPDHKKLAAKINHQTLKAAAAIKNSAR